MIREVNVQPNHQGSIPHECKFRLLLLKNTAGASPTVFLSIKELWQFILKNKR
jgi:hypothetical protein